MTKRLIEFGFLSTLSLRRATISAKRETRESIDFYPRSPCGERLHLFASSGVDFAISIHALLAESDRFQAADISAKRDFYPRSPCGERRCYSLRHSAQVRHFYPRSPCGERRVTVLGIQHRCGISIHALLAESDRLLACSVGSVCSFLSTLSLRRATTSSR